MKAGKAKSEQRKGLFVLVSVILAACGANISTVNPAPSNPAALPSLISADSLVALMSRGPVRILDVRQQWTDYLLNHLPEAEWAQVESFRAAERGLPFQLLSGDSYRSLFQRLGVDRSAPVVIYSAGDANDIDATYLAWLLAGMGHTSVRVLDGGYAKWVLDNRPLGRSYPKIDAPAALRGRFNPEAAGLAEVRAVVQGNGTVLVDARSAAQFAGTAGAQRRRGHIPGAIDHPWASDLETRDLALVWKPADALRASYVTQGITPDKPIIVYCNTGTEASHLWFALRAILHYPNVRIYTGAWSEWSEREDTPVVSGP
ncbi:MAG: sulfurtransferase [Gemmatimonadota bacterium]